MSPMIGLELTLLALESCEFDDFVEEIDEILECIKNNKIYDNAPTLSIIDLYCVLKRMCMRHNPYNLIFKKNAIYDIRYNPATFNRQKGKIRSILIENI